MWKSLVALLRAPNWKRTAAANTTTITVLWAFLLGVLIYGCVRTGSVESAFIIYHGPCSRSRTYNLLLHLLLNIISTLVLSSSSFFMQILSAPTRLELDRAHGRSSWVHIGVPSLRNFMYQRPLKLACWVLLACSSVPLHLFFNSISFEVRNVRSTFGMTIATESFLDGGAYFGPGASLWNTAVPYNCSILGLPGHKKNDDLCRKSMRQDSSVWISEGYSPGEGLIFPSTWTNESSDVKASLTLAAATASNWDLLDPETCRREFLYCGDGKGMQDHTNVVLVVNTSASSIPNPGWTRKQVFPLMGQADSEFWKDIVPEEERNSLWLYKNCVVMSAFDDGKCRNSCKPNLGLQGLATDDVDIVDPSSNTDRSWLRAYAIFLAALILALDYFYRATDGTFRISGDFGASGKNGFVTQDQGSSDEYTGDFIRLVLLANVPQGVLSVSYLSFNSLITQLSVAKEWALMSTGFHPLRVTSPSGEQVATHLLGLPYSWSVPCIALGILLHWLVSNSCYVFMTDGGFYGSWTGSPTMTNNTLGLSDFGFVGLGYSTVAIMISIVIFAITICIPILLGVWRLPGNNVIVGSNSLAIAAACHASTVSSAGGHVPSSAEHEPAEEGAETSGLMRVDTPDPGEEALATSGDENNWTQDSNFVKLSRSKVKWGVVKMPPEFYANLAEDLDDIAVEHLSFGVEADMVGAPVYGKWYS
ncbi:hypothetical protein O9K51_06913 [Purpureocillium lavendulum]|uniref:DUF6536 domain-containing protein n=1 Tax=Purpureocillium lavendulum TaxID=1247861 RepID=A0AB34FNS0_9HYPO|nr:hypothetical protein O9K51_06913 [Purpureocillium lavendulum]